MSLTLLITKIVVFISSKLNKGSSFPGKLALKLDKNILNKLKVPKNIIAVTGSSGKGTTSKMIASVLKSMNYKVVHNFRGGNLKTGITTMLIESSKLNGVIDADYLVYEIDEQYVKQVFFYLHPQIVVITNIVRDQPPRHGHFDFVYDEIKKCLTSDMHLILNSDDPYLQKFALETTCQITSYGIEKNKYSYLKNNYDNLIIQYCPQCHKKLKYNYYNFEIYGDYYCPNCSFERLKPDYAVTNINYDIEEMIINNKYKIKILNNILYNIYNISATVATLGSLNFNLEKLIPYINKTEYDHKLCNHYKYNNKDFYIFYNKCENSSSFNQSLNYVARNKDTKTIIIGWEKISHRYKFSDISWIYDINFESLSKENIKKFICVGSNCYDIAARLKYAGFDVNKIVTCNFFPDTIDDILNDDSNTIFAIVNPDYVLPLIKKLKGKNR